MKVVGIGRFYAKAIVRFRQQTGGFVNIDQLHELYGMTDQNFNKISPYCHINTALVQKIKVNTASTERLNVHPYLNFYQSKAIYEYRRKKGKLQGIQELRNINELSSETVGKIEPYLSFE
jgi:DNA uptake protein ComE-like DNA-binding protein